jgi:hypothetical protein
MTSLSVSGKGANVLYVDIIDMGLSVKCGRGEPWRFDAPVRHSGFIL